MAIAAEKVSQESPEPYLVDPQKSLDRALNRSGMSEIKAAFAPPVSERINMAASGSFSGGKF
jgi:hypothetical protein